MMLMSFTAPAIAQEECVSPSTGDIVPHPGPYPMFCNSPKYQWFCDMLGVTFTGPQDPGYIAAVKEWRSRIVPYLNCRLEHITQDLQVSILGK